jgi:hypothetical protein
VLHPVSELKRTIKRLSRLEWDPDTGRASRQAVDHTADRERYASDPVAFIRECCHIFDKKEKRWLRFDLWPAQVEALLILQAEQQTVILKARQQGFTWLALSFALWLMLFHPTQEVLLFSLRDEEAKELVGHRLCGIHHRLPAWLKEGERAYYSAHQLRLPNGSRAISFPTTGGRSYAATFVLVDEADFIPKLGDLLNAVQPTVDAGGKLILLSTADKAQPQSAFKGIWRAARRKENEFRALFYPWSAHPGRDAAWYAAKLKACLATTGVSDNVFQEYPSTPEEALAPRSLDKRLPAQWVSACFREDLALTQAELLLEHFTAPAAPSLPFLTVFAKPQQGCQYVIGADPAEGNPTSDESAATVLDEATGEQVAVLAGRIEPDVFAQYVCELARWYNKAAALVERNNHGAAVLLWLKDNATGIFVLNGHDRHRGWLSHSRGKALLYDGAATRLREGRCLIRDPATYFQLCSIEGGTLRAPVGEADDRADAFALAIAAIDQTPRGRFEVYV